MTMRWWALLLALVAALPVVGEAATPVSPDRRAVPLLVSQSGNLRRYGTGVVVGAGTILTARHVLGDTVQVVGAKGPVGAKAVCGTRFEGLAVVRAPLPGGTPRYSLSSRVPAAGERVTVAGYPLRRWRVASGRVTRIIRSARLSGRVVRTTMIVFTPALDYGASGAPLFDARGRVVGITIASNRGANYSIALPVATGLGACRRFLP